MNNKPLSIYIHWPFCRKKCPYCNFNSHVNTQPLDQELWTKAYLSNIQKFQHLIKNKKIHSIFFGGGTPSLMPTIVARSILEEIDKISPLNNCEITLETNPTSFEKNKFKELKTSGINRISIGIQSFNDNNLKFLGREHSAKEAEKTIIEADKIFNNYSIDLIYSLPNHTIETWQEELLYALKFAKHHISLYQLTIEKGTPFFTSFRDKKFTLPSEETERTLYLLTQKITEQYGFNNYEVSNFAKTNKESQHNLAYWKYQEYLGIGPGAHSRVNIANNYSAFHMIHSPEKWLSLTVNNENNIQINTILSKQDIAHEYLIMGLRLQDGVDFKKFQQRFHMNLLDFLDINKIIYFEKENLLTYNNDKLYLKGEGRLLINHILKQLVK